MAPEVRDGGQAGDATRGIALLLALFAPYFFYRHITPELPVGTGWLYALMAERIAANGFALPGEIPLFGPGGIPFAYPPFAFYMMAAVTEATGAPPFAYLRVVPPALLLASLVPMFFLARRVTDSTTSAWWATALFAMAPSVTEMHNEGAGICRGLALLAMLWAIVCVDKSVARPNAALLSLAVALSSITVLTHPKYATFLALSTALLALRRPSRFGVLVGIGAASALVVSPWVLYVIHVHGFRVFAMALETHDTFGFLHYLSHPQALAELLDAVLLRQGNILIAGATVLGIAVHVAARAWFPLVWMAATVLAMGITGARFVAIVGAILAATAIGLVCRGGSMSQPPHVPNGSFRTAFFVTVLLATYVPSFAWSVRTTPINDPALRTVAAWIQTNTAGDRTVLLATDKWNEHELFTFLTRRPPLVSPYGAEWTGSFQQQYRRLGQVVSCAHRGSYPCLEDRFRRWRLWPDVIVAPVDAPRSMSAALDEASGWVRLHAEARYGVWVRSRNERARTRP